MQWFRDPSSFQYALPPLRAVVDVVQLISCVWLCNSMDCSTPGFPVLPYLLEFAQTHVHWVGDAIKPSHPLLSPSPPSFPSFSLSQHQGLSFPMSQFFPSVGQILEFLLQHQSFQLSGESIISSVLSCPNKNLKWQTSVTVLGQTMSQLSDRSVLQLCFI